jgi:eukaryotic-like serine/threonine-protein kinase
VIKDLRPSDPVSVGPYRLLGLLGTGGMGQVYLARSPGGRQVAIKVIKPELAEEREFRVRFAREIAAARNVSGIFTAAVVDADPDGPEPWLATAYVAGPSLAEAGSLPEESVLALAAGLAEGLHAIHRAGLVHRDLKPSNVLLASDGPRVIDFGISRAREGSMLTQTKTVMGTAGYMSPEQARGLVVGPASDVFSLGAVLTFAATGEGPFGTGPTDAMIYRVVHEPPDLSRVPDGLRPLIERCMVKVPQDRPTTGQLLDELGPRVSEITGNWLPERVSDSLGGYVRTTPNPVTPAVQVAAEPGTADIAPAQVADAADQDAQEAAEPVVAEAAIAQRLPAEPVPAEPVPAEPVPAEPMTAAAGLGAAQSEPTVPDAAEQKTGDPEAGGPVVPLKGTVVPLKGKGRKGWLLAAVAAAAAIVAAVTLVLELSPGGPPNVIGGPTPVVAVTSQRATAKPTPTPSATPTKKPAKKPAKKLAPPAKHVAKKHSSAPAPSTTPAAAPTQPQQAPTTPVVNPTTPSPVQTTPPPSGPQTIGSTSGAAGISCDQFGNVGSSPGGSSVSFSFVNQSNASVQVWYLTSSANDVPEGTLSPGQRLSPAVATGQDWMVGNSGGGCLSIFGITGNGEVVVVS